MDYWKKWGKAASIRALKTFGQTLVALISANTIEITALDWPQLLGIAATATVLSFATSLAGLPEVPETETGEVG